MLESPPINARSSREKTSTLCEFLQWPLRNALIQKESIVPDALAVAVTTLTAKAAIHLYDKWGTGMVEFWMGVALIGTLTSAGFVFMSNRTFLGQTPEPPLLED